MHHATHTQTKKQVDMLNPLKSTLRTSFPEKDGWKLYNRYNWSSRVHDYVLQKESGDSTLRIVVEINFGDQVLTDDFNKFAALSRRLESGKIKVIRTVMVIQENSRIEGQPFEGLEIMNMAQLIQNGVMGLKQTLSNSKLVA